MGVFDRIYGVLSLLRAFKRCGVYSILASRSAFSFG